MVKLRTEKLPDIGAERVRENHRQAIEELQERPFPQIIQNIKMQVGVTVSVSHSLGREPLFVRESCARGGVAAGSVLEVREDGYDRAKTLRLRAVGYFADVFIDLMVL